MRQIEIKEVCMNEDIGGAAGEIWRLLGTRGEVVLAQLPRVVNYRREVVYQGLGWLAREGKVNYTTRAGKTFIALTDAEKNVFKRNLLQKPE
jgi:hypothetical protein